MAITGNSDFKICILEFSFSSNNRSLVFAMLRSHGRFPGKARTDNNVNVYLEKQFNTLRIKVSAKCSSQF